MNRRTKLSNAINRLTNIVSIHYPLRKFRIYTPKFIVTIERHESKLTGHAAGIIIVDHPLLKE